MQEGHTGREVDTKMCVTTMAAKSLYDLFYGRRAVMVTLLIMVVAWSGGTLASESAPEPEANSTTPEAYLF